MGKLAAMHTAWFGTYAETIRRSPHAAELMIASARGLESIAASPAAYRRHLDALVRLMIAGLSRRLPAGPVPPG